MSSSIEFTYPLEIFYGIKQIRVIRRVECVCIIALENVFLYLFIRDSCCLFLSQRFVVVYLKVKNPFCFL